MKRLKRQRQEAARAALEAAAAVPTDDSDGSVQHNRSEGSAQQNPFDLLDASHSADSEPSEEDKDIVNDEHALPSTAVESDLASAGAKKNSGRKMTKKKKKKSKKQPISQGINDILLSNCVESGDSEGLDDIDRYLKELDGKSPSSSSPSLSETLKGKDRADSGESADAELLSVDKKNLDANVEMRRMFGSRVVNSQMERNARRGGAARANTGVPRSLLTVLSSSLTLLPPHRTLQTFGRESQTLALTWRLSRLVRRGARARSFPLLIQMPTRASKRPFLVRCICLIPAHQKHCCICLMHRSLKTLLYMPRSLKTLLYLSHAPLTKNVVVFVSCPAHQKHCCICNAPLTKRRRGNA